MSSVFAVSVAILLAANDVFGENTNIHFRSLALLPRPICGSVRLGGNVDFRNGGMGGKVDFGIDGMVGKVVLRIGGSVRLGVCVDSRISPGVDFRIGPGVTLVGNVGNSGRVRFGGNIDASKLSQVVGKDTNSDSTSVRISRRTSAKKAGMMICNAVTMMRRFCSSQFFHSNNPNCDTFDSAMVALDAALSSI